MNHGMKWLGTALSALICFAEAINAATPSAGAAKPSVDFIRDIRPILSDNCFTCHGPDDGARKAKLRFDIRDDALKPAKSGEKAIVPGQPEASELVKRILATDEEDVMPPPKTKKKLTAQQIDLLKRWIGEGAPYASHWAYETPQQPPVPEVKNRKWARNPIDNFIAARLEKENLKPSPEADKPTLIRRASLDLTGLPPTIEEIDQFLADKSPQAYEKVVDRLLESPRYGEHMAKYWLDAVRYADSHGYHIDSQRDIWAYRDWVVNAFNQNKRFDEFTVEQLAGDLLPEATTDQKIASGYVRCNMSTGEGGAIETEYLAKYSFDRTETTAAVWMGMTLMCARCHTHKYDPIQHKEYYSLLAFFNNLDEPIMDGNKPNPDPFIKLPSKEQAERLDWLKKNITDGQQKIDGPVPELDQTQTGWAKQWSEKLSRGWTTLAPETMKSTSTNGAELKLLDDKSVLAEGPNPEQDTFELTFKVEAGSLAGFRLEALPNDSLPHKSAARADDGKFRLSEFEAEIVLPEKDGKKPDPQKLKFAHSAADAAEGDATTDKAVDGKADTGWGVDEKSIAQPHTAVFVLAEPAQVPADAELRVRLKFEASKSKRAIGHFRLAAARDPELVNAFNPPKFEPWHAIGPFKTEGLQAGFAKQFEPENEVDLKKAYPGVREEIKWSARGDLADGKSHLFVNELHGVHGAFYFHRVIQAPADTKVEFSLRADDLFKVWVNGEQVLERATPEATSARFSVDLKKGTNTVLVKVVNHQGAKYFSFNKQLGGADSVPPEIAAVLALGGEASGANFTKVRNYYRRTFSADFKELFDNVDKWREEETAIDRAIPTTMVAKERQQWRETTMFARGEYDKPGDKVGHGVPSILPPLPADAPTNRLGLAKWLVDPKHPLTSRVAVNRLWQQVFGVGFVKTTEDFGVQGERPSHPELLDWLATDLVQNGWDIKRLMKQIVTSATYRQTAKASPELRSRDPENRLLARGPRFRPEGEVVRDTALFVGGLLVDKRGGRSVKPYEPPGLWEAVSFNNSQKYVQDTGEAQYRRSLYTSWKRQSPPPNMLIFDAPTREYCVVRRPRTNTPLQALVTLNDPQFVEASRSFAQRIMLEGGSSIESRIAYAFRLATARKPSADEVKVIRDVFAQQLADFQKDTDAAEKFLNVGSFKAKEACDKAELAAWTTIASMILNLDETLTKG